MTIKQLVAIKKLEAAFLTCLRARLVFCGVDTNLLCVQDTPKLRDEIQKASPAEVILKLENELGGDVRFVKTYRTYLDSGGA